MTSFVDKRLLDEALRTAKELDRKLNRKIATEGVPVVTSSIGTDTKGIEVNAPPGFKTSSEKLGFDFMNVNDIVDNVVNRSISMPPLPNDKKSVIVFPAVTERKSSEGGFVDIEMPFKGVMTDLVTYEFLKSREVYARFTYSFTTLMLFALNRYRTKMGLAETDIGFIFKGGDVLRQIIEKFADEESGEFTNFFREHFGQFFKKSDADFQIAINPNIPEPKYTQVYKDMQIMAYCILVRVRTIYLGEHTYSTDFEMLKPEYAVPVLKKYVDKLNATADNLPADNPYKNVKFISLVYDNLAYTDPAYADMMRDLKFDMILDRNLSIDDSSVGGDYDDPEKGEGESRSQATYKAFVNDISQGIGGSNRADIRITKITNNDVDQYEPEDMKKNVAIYKMRYPNKSKYTNKMNDSKFYQDNFGDNDRNSMYITANNSLFFDSALDSSIIFALVRAKINFRAFYLTTDKKVGVLNIGGEFIDVSIPHKKAMEMKHFFFENEKNVMNERLIKLTMNYPSLPTPFSYHTYSINYYIYDLLKMLFEEVRYSYLDPKYSKRIARVWVLFVVNMFYGENNPEAKYIPFLDQVAKIRDFCAKIASASSSAPMKDIAQKVAAASADKSHSGVQNLLKTIVGVDFTFVENESIRSEMERFLHHLIIQFAYAEEDLVNKKENRYAKLPTMFEDFRKVLEDIHKLISIKIKPQMPTMNRLQEMKFFGGARGKTDAEYKEKYLKYKMKYEALSKKMKSIMKD